jgi:hypothetical protein
VSAKIDPVEVASRWLNNYQRAHVADGGVTVDVNEAVALARVVLAAEAYRLHSGVKEASALAAALKVVGE